MLDSHVHLWPHSERASLEALSLDNLARYVERARVVGIGELTFTEHVFRFREGLEAVGEFWSTERDPSLRESMAAYFAHHATADLDSYVVAVCRAKDAGLPVSLGLEVDYYPGRMAALSGLLARYPFDMLLGSVHWIGTWRFDDLDDARSMREWRTRDPAHVWHAYTDLLVDLIASGACDVLAHLDLAKVAGVRASVEVLEQCYARIAAAVIAADVAVEISSAGLRKPAAELYPAPRLLDLLVAGDVALTTASDAHEPSLVGDRFDLVGEALSRNGVAELRAFTERQPRRVALVARTQ